MSVARYIILRKLTYKFDTKQLVGMVTGFKKKPQWAH